MSNLTLSGDEETADLSGAASVSATLSSECPEIYTPHLEVNLSGLTHPYNTERPLHNSAFTTETRPRALDPRAK